MSRGGYRVGSGGISTWNHGKTKTIRVPIELAERVLTIARALDRGDSIVLSSASTFDSVTESKVLDLSGVKVRADRDGVVVRLDELISAGYQIYPEKLAKSLEPILRGFSGG